MYTAARDSNAFPRDATFLRELTRSSLAFVYGLVLLLWNPVAVAQEGPEISVDPEALAFGSKPVNSRHIRSVIVRNTGGAILHVTNIAVVPTVSSFRIVSGVDSIAIAPGAQVPVDIVYSPTAIGEDAARLVIQSTDAPEVIVLLSGFGALKAAPEIRVSPLALDFHEVFIGASNSMKVRITNTGTARLEVMSIAFGPATSGDFALTGFAGPIGLALGASIETQVTYSPGDEGVDEGTLVITSDDADRPSVSVSLVGSGVPEPTPQIQVVPTAIDFMDVFIGSSHAMSLEVTNTGSAPLELTSVALGPGSSEDFAITGPSEPVLISPGASFTTEVTYSPLDEGADSGTLVIENSDPTQPVVTVSLVGVGVPVPAPQIQVTPLDLEFSEVFIDSSSRMEVEIENTGTASLEITSIALGPETSGEFSITGFDQSISLAPGSSVTTEVTYSPVDQGVDSGTLVIDSNDATDPQVTVSLSGSGVPAPVPQIQVTAPLKLNYGTVFIGAASPMSLGIGNVGTAPLEVTGIELGPDTSGDFSITGFSDPITLVPGGSVTTEVTYMPTDVGPDSGTILIKSNDSDQPVVTVSLAGSGVPIPVPRIQVTPTSVEFGNRFIASSSSMTVEISNIGTARLDVSSIHLGPETSGDFAITGFDQRIILVPDASVLTEITYTPADEGADSGTLVIESDDVDMQTVIVSLNGVGVPEPMAQIEVTPLALDYGQVQVGSRSTRTVTIGNAGMETLDVLFIGLGADTRGEFLITAGPASVSVPPGEEVSVDVAYAPSDAGSDSGTLRIQSNDAHSPSIDVSLSGTGVPAPVPRISVDPTSLLFGDVTIGSSAALTVTIGNEGSAPLELTVISLGVATSDDFAITGGEGSASLVPGDEATVEVTYTPTDEAADSGTLRIASNDVQDPLVTISLFGTGVLDNEPVFRRGDSNTDGIIDIADPITTIGFLFRDDTPRPTCFDAADSNDDGGLDLSDGIFTLSYLFNGGAPSPAPGSDKCGVDPTEDGLSLCVYPIALCAE